MFLGHKMIAKLEFLKNTLRMIFKNFLNMFQRRASWEFLPVLKNIWGFLKHVVLPTIISEILQTLAPNYTGIRNYEMSPRILEENKVWISAKCWPVRNRGRDQNIKIMCQLHVLLFLKFGINIQKPIILLIAA